MGVPDRPRAVHPGSPLFPTTPAVQKRLQQAGRVSGHPAETCELCRSRLDPKLGDDPERARCASCLRRAETSDSAAGKSSAVASPLPAARGFTPGEKALIRKIHGFMPAQQLLSILNERLVADRGAGVVRHTMEQLHTEIGDAGGVAARGGGTDWANLRKTLAAARKSGTLDAICEQTIEDFAVVFSLNARQLLTLKEVVLGAKDGRS